MSSTRKIDNEGGGGNYHENEKKKNFPDSDIKGNMLKLKGKGDYHPSRRSLKHDCCA